MKQCFSTLGCVERPLADILTLAQTYQIPYLELRGIGGVIDNREIAAFAPDRIGATRTILEDAGLRVRVIGASASFHDPGSGLPPLRKRTKPCGLLRHSARPISACSATTRAMTLPPQSGA